MYAFCLPSDLLLKQQQQQQRKTHKQKQQKTTNKQERSPNIYTLKYIVFFFFLTKKKRKRMYYLFVSTTSQIHILYIIRIYSLYAGIFFMHLVSQVNFLIFMFSKNSFSVKLFGPGNQERTLSQF